MEAVRQMGVEALITAVDVPGPFAPGQFIDALVIPVVTMDLEQIRLTAKPRWDTRSDRG